MFRAIFTSVLSATILLKQCFDSRYVLGGLWLIIYFISRKGHIYISHNAHLSSAYQHVKYLYSTRSFFYLPCGYETRLYICTSWPAIHLFQIEVYQVKVINISYYVMEYTQVQVETQGRLGVHSIGHLRLLLSFLFIKYII